jgi:hypothetical protein
MMIQYRGSGRGCTGHREATLGSCAMRAYDVRRDKAPVGYGKSIGDALDEMS